MSEREFEAYLNLLARFLKLSPEQRAAIEKELRDHLEQRLEELYEKGYSRDDAIETALAEFGDAAGLADDFAKATRGPRIRRRIMQTSIGTLAAAAAIALAFTFMLPEQRPGVPERPAGWAAQEEEVQPRVLQVRSEPLALDPAPAVEALKERITVDLPEVTLGEVFGSIEEQTGVPIEGYDPDFEFGYRVRDTRAIDVLHMVAAELGSLEGVRSGIMVGTEDVTIGAARHAPRVWTAGPDITGLYDVRDLLDDAESKRRQAHALMRTLRTGTGWLVRTENLGRYYSVYDGLLSHRYRAMLHERVQDTLAWLREARQVRDEGLPEDHGFSERAEEAGLLVAAPFPDQPRLEQTFSLSVEDAPLAHVLSDIRFATGARLVVEWHDEHMMPGDRVTLAIDEATGFEALEAIQNVVGVPLRVTVNRDTVGVSVNERAMQADPDREADLRMELAYGYTTRIYDVMDLLGNASDNSERATALREMLMSAAGFPTHEQHFAIFDGLLTVHFSPDDHERLERFLITLRAARQALAE